MINNTTLVGRLTRNPELKYTGNGIAVLSFSLAVERNFTNAQGERETDFINCVIWRGAAENLAKFAAKGSLIGITGSIQTRNYQNNEGQTIYTTEVHVDNFQMLEPRSVTEKRKEGQSVQHSKETTVKPKDGYESVNFDDTADINDDDLPF